jgi:hypothetical protein
MLKRATFVAAAIATALIGSAAAKNSPMTSMSNSTSMAPGKDIPTVKAASLPPMMTSGKSMPMPMRMVPLGQADWEGMTIAARTSAPATFILLNGSREQMVKPTARDSFHLMVLLSDQHTGFAIPYSSVWATIKKGRKIVFDERLWPMISRSMGPHYGNNVALPGAGVYELSLLVSPPTAARHMEYRGYWLKPHRVNLAFRWVPKT